jgi:hypothetical protein
MNKRICELMHISEFFTQHVTMMHRIVLTTFGSLGDLHPYIAIALNDLSLFSFGLLLLFRRTVRYSEPGNFLAGSLQWEGENRG